MGIKKRRHTWDERRRKPSGMYGVLKTSMGKQMKTHEAF